MKTSIKTTTWSLDGTEEASLRTDKGLILRLAAILSMVLLAAVSGLGEGTPALGLWPSEPPQGCPFPPSGQITGLAFTGHHAEYTGADTWYPSWASDGNLYSPWTDGNVNGLGSNSFGTNATTGFARIVGGDPTNLRVVDQGVYGSAPSPYAGR